MLYILFPPNSRVSILWDKYSHTLECVGHQGTLNDIKDWHFRAHRCQWSPGPSPSHGGSTMNPSYDYFLSPWVKNLDIVFIKRQNLWIDIQIFTVPVFQHTLPFMVLYHYGRKDQGRVLKTASSPLVRNINQIQYGIVNGMAKISATVEDLKVRRWSFPSCT